MGGGSNCLSNGSRILSASKSTTWQIGQRLFVIVLAELAAFGASSMLAYVRAVGGLCPISVIVRRGAGGLGQGDTPTMRPSVNPRTCCTHASVIFGCPLEPEAGGRRGRVPASRSARHVL